MRYALFDGISLGHIINSVFAAYEGLHVPEEQVAFPAFLTYIDKNQTLIDAKELNTDNHAAEQYCSSHLADIYDRPASVFPNDPCRDYLRSANFVSQRHLQLPTESQVITATIWNYHVESSTRHLGCRTLQAHMRLSRSSFCILPRSSQCGPTGNR